MGIVSETSTVFLSKLFGLVTYLDWVMIVVTTLSCISMLFETPQNRVMNSKELQVVYSSQFCLFYSLQVKLRLYKLFLSVKSAFAVSH